MFLFLVSYFEDFISNIGIWKALRTKHIEFYGTPVPFLAVNQEKYDYEYINKEDIKFLLFQFLNFISNYENRYLFAHQELDVVTNKIYDLFDKEYETAHETDYYDDFFTIKETNDYFKIREKVFWLSKSYLFEEITNEFMSSNMEEYQNPQTQEDLIRIQIAGTGYTEDSIYKNNTEFSALTVFELFVELARATPECKKKLKQIDKRNWGFYKFLSKQGKYTIFENIGTKKEYKVLSDSMGKGGKMPKNALFVCTFILWNNDWWLSGLLMQHPDTKLTDETKGGFQRELYLYSPFYKEKMDEMVIIQQKDFKNYFN